MLKKLTDKQIYEKMAKLYEFKEWTPLTNDNEFTKYSDNLYQFNIEKIPKIEYFTKDLTDTVNEHMKLYHALKETEKTKIDRSIKGKILKFFRVFDGEISYVGYTEKNIVNYLLPNYERLLDKKFNSISENPLGRFAKTLNKVKIEILEVYKVTSDTKPQKELNQIRDRLMNQNGKNDNMFMLYENQINLMIKDCVLNEKTYYIYRYGSEKKAFYWYSVEKYTDKNNMTDILFNMFGIIFNNDKKILTTLKVIKSILDVFIGLEVDKILKENDEIEKSYNEHYYIFNSKYNSGDANQILKDLHLVVQNSVIRNTLDNNDFINTFGYVYRIEVNEKNFVGLETKGTSMIELMTKIIEKKTKNEEYAKLMKEIRKAQIGCINVECLKFKPEEKSRINLDNWKLKMIKKYKADDENVGLNYTDDAKEKDKLEKYNKIKVLKVSKK